MDRIDNLDRKILDIITKNARIPSKEIAQECGVSRTSVQQRIQRMAGMGIITGSAYKVNPKSLGYHTCTYIGVRLGRGTLYREVLNLINRIPEVIECHFTTGPYTMLLKLYARDNEHLMEILNDEIQTIAGVEATEALISLDNAIQREVPMLAAQ